MVLIANQKRFLQICQIIEQEKIVAIDTEFVRETTYLPVLCLLQINVLNKCYVIDILQEIDLSAFFKILNNPKIIKIFHSARQDLEVFFANFSKQIKPQAIFDTQIMAAICGLGYNLSYGNLVKSLLDKNIDKTLQRSDWQQRPLQKNQIKYAKIDVLHLPEIYQILIGKLKQQRKIRWIKEEIILATKKADNEDLCRNFPLINKSQQYQENVVLLTKWRDKIAKENNVPRGFILKDKVLDKIANFPPKNMDQLQKYGFKNRFFEGKISQKAILLELFNLLLNHCQQTIKNKEMKEDAEILKTHFKLNENQKELYQLSKILLQNQANKHQINPEIIINQNNLQNIISGFKAIENVLFGWRYKVFGQDLEKLLGKNC